VIYLSDIKRLVLLFKPGVEDRALTLTVVPPVKGFWLNFV